MTQADNAAALGRSLEAEQDEAEASVYHLCHVGLHYSDTAVLTGYSAGNSGPGHETFTCDAHREKYGIHPLVVAHIMPPGWPAG